MVRPDQRQALARIAKTLGVPVSNVIRWFVDYGIEAVEGVQSYQQLQEERMAQDAADDHA